MRTISLQQGAAHQRFRVNLDNQSVEVRLNWLTRFGYYSVDISVDGERQASGRGLHPEINLLEGTSVAGELYILGRQPTPNNLTVDNRLVYKEPA